MESKDDLEIEVVYAREEQQHVIALRVPRGTMAGEAVKISGLPNRFRELQSATLQLGIYGTRVSVDTELAPGDRIEIYRPLVADPKHVRRTRARRSASSR